MWSRVLRQVGSMVPRRWTTRAAMGRLIVLCYHDLRGPEDFTSWLRVEVGAFRHHLEALSELGGFVSPSALEAPEDLPTDRLNFLVTFDDGYPNNLRLGADALVQAGVPALFFVSTHHLVTQQPFWFDRVVTRVQAAQLARLDLTRFGLPAYTFHPVDGARRWEDVQRLLADLKRLGNDTDPDVTRVLDWLDAEYGSAAAAFDDVFRPIGVSELKELASRRQMFIGSHAHRHEILTRLDRAALLETLTTSKQVLEKLLSQTVTTLAFPNGDQNEQVRAACAAVGYTKGFTTTPGLVPRRPTFLQIPRLLVGGYDSAAEVTAAVKALVLSSLTARLFDRSV